MPFLCCKTCFSRENTDGRRKEKNGQQIEEEELKKLQKENSLTKPI